MLTQDEMDKAVLEAKKSLSDEQIKEAIKRCSYGGSPVSMVHTGGFIAKEDIPKVNSGWCGTCGAFNNMTHEAKDMTMEELLSKSKRRVVKTIGKTNA